MGIKASDKSEYIPTDEIFFRTNGGYDAYMYYLGRSNVKRIMNRPWGKKEKHPSWGIYERDGIWWWKDHGTSEKAGTIIQFVQNYFGLDFKQSVDKLAWDFGISTEQGINASPVVVSWEAPDERTKEEYISIKFDTMPFEKRHHDYWNIAEVSEDHCKKMNTFALKKLVVKNQFKHIGADEVAFVYVCEEGVKVYFPHREQKFKNNVPYRYLWNYDKLEHCEDLIIQKSNKDMNVTTMITPCVISTQAEAIKIFNTEVVDKVNAISTRPWIWYGSDDDGVKKCKEITGCNKWRYINTPKKLLPDVNDTYSFVKYHNLQKMGTGLRTMEEFMKQKKLLK